MKSKNNQKKVKTNIFIILFSVLMILLVARLFYLMFIKDEYYQKKAYSQQILKKDIYSTRGEIVDVNSITLAASVEVANVFLDPELIREVYGNNLHQDINELFIFLENNFDLERNTLLKSLKMDGHYYVILKKISKAKEEMILNYKSKNNITGIYTEREVKRVYPNNQMAAQIVGFVNNQENGQLGIEYQFNNMLKGNDGTIITQIDAVGREIPFSTSTTIDAENGFKIYLTVDSNIQNYVQDSLEAAIDKYKVLNGGSIIVMNPNNGNVLALATYPYFDCNNPDKWIDYIDEMYSVDSELSDIEMISKYSWRNKAISDSYEPGSTFKAITLASCLEEGIVTPDDIYESDSVVVDGWTINHWMPNPPKTENITQAMYNSSNPVFVRIAQDLGMAKFYEYIDYFGFNSITGIELPGEAGSIFANDPNALDMAVNSFGQRFQITPIQLITAYCAIANGGDLLKPHIIDKIENSSGIIQYESNKTVVREILSDQTCTEMKKILEGTVEEGTGINAYIKGYKLAGKTGTSETLETDEGRYIASFAGFAPADSPEVAILVVLDYPSIEEHGGGFVAAPVAKDVLEKTLSYMKVERQYSDRDLQIINSEKIIPNLYRYTAKEAEEELKKENMEFKNLCKNEKNILKQVPEAGEKVSQDPVVIFYDELENYRYSKVPNLIGMTKEEAYSVLKENYLNIRIDGFGEVVSQNIEKGREVLSGSIIELELKETDFSTGD